MDGPLLDLHGIITIYSHALPESPRNIDAPDDNAAGGVQGWIAAVSGGAPPGRRATSDERHGVSVSC